MKKIIIGVVLLLSALGSFAQQTPDATITITKRGDNPVVIYTSGSTVYEEGLNNGELVGRHWSANGYVQREGANTPGSAIWDVLKDYHYNSFELEMDGLSLETGWQWVNAYQRKGEKVNTIEGVVELKNEFRPITLKVITRLDGSAILARYLEITNNGKTQTALSKVSPMSGVLWNINPSLNDGNSQIIKENSKFTLGYFGGLHWGTEGQFNWETLPQETFRIEREFLSHQNASPYYIVRNDFNGEMFFIGLAWSGKYSAEFRHYRDENRLSFRTGPMAYGSLRIIDPDETIKSPEIHIGPVHGTLDQAVAQWYNHMNSSVIPAWPKDHEPFTVAGRVVEQPGDWLLKEIDMASELGIEAFMVDAGWYGDHFASWGDNRGDWNDGNWLPTGGMAGLRDYIHKKNMMFGIWHEPEGLSTTSLTAKTHPDWGNFTSGDKQGGLNFFNPEATKYFRESVAKVFRDYKPDYYKIDLNYDLYGRRSIRTVETPNGKLIENEDWRHYETLYDMFDQVSKDYPGVIRENCAGGGGRNDLGMVSRFHFSSMSDVSTYPNSICNINSMSLFIPPSALMCYLNIQSGSSYTDHFSDLQTFLRVTLFSIPIWGGFTAQDADRSTWYFRESKRYIKLNKTFCRRVMANQPVVFHHTPEAGIPNNSPWCVLEYARPDKTCGYAGVFKLKTDGNNEYLFLPKGIDFSKQYKVTLDNDQQTFVVSGRDLAQNGIRIRLDQARTSELIMYEIDNGIIMTKKK